MIISQFISFTHRRRRVETQGRCHTLHWLITFRGLVLTCFILFRSTINFHVNSLPLIKSEDSPIPLFKKILYSVLAARNLWILPSMELGNIAITGICEYCHHWNWWILPSLNTHVRSARHLWWARVHRKEMILKCRIKLAVKRVISWLRDLIG